MFASDAAGRQLTWPHGQAVEVILRTRDTTVEPRAWVIAGPITLASPSRSEVEAIGTRPPSASDVASAPLRPVGASATDTGREHYEVGDRHAVITGVASGQVTVCAAGRGEPTAIATCTLVTLAPTVEVEFPDGRYAAGATPVVLLL